MSNKPTVLFIERCDRKYIPPVGIGRELNSSYHVSQVLKKHGYNSAIISWRGYEDNSLSVLKCVSSSPLEVAQQIKNLNYDVLIISSWIELLDAIENYEKKKILVFRGMRNLDNVRKFKTVINDNVFRVVTVSSTQRQVLVDAGIDKELLTVIPNGVNLKIFRLKQSVRQLKHLVFIGALVEEKGIDTLLEVFRLLLSRHPDVKLTICGSEKIYGKKPGNFSKALMGNDSIIFRGLVSQSEVARVLNHASYCIVPTNPNLIFETFSKATHEAQLMGCIPIVSTSGCLPYIVKDGVNGFVFNPYSVKSLYEKLLNIFAKDIAEIQKIRKDTIAHAKKNVYSWEEVTSMFLNII